MKTYNSDWTVIYFDGAAEPTNPGPASGAAVIDLPTGESITVTVDLGVQTNNVAEYSGAIAGLKKALELGCKCVALRGDSQLVIYQLEGKYGCHSANLKPLCLEAKQLLSEFEEYDLQWIPREQNSRADAAAGDVLSSKVSPTVEILDDLPVPEPRYGLEAQILRLQTLGLKASFKEWLKLKSGRDEFSSFKGDSLASLVPDEVKTVIDSALQPLEQEKFKSAVYRWYLRGLPPALALKKCRVDSEANAKAQTFT